MPQKEQTIIIEGYDAESMLALAYGAFERIGWNTQYAGPVALVAHTPKSWNKNADEVIIIIDRSEMKITSKLVNGEVYDIFGKNKKHIADFIGAFEMIKKSATLSQIEKWKEAFAALHKKTLEVIAEEEKQAEEVEKIMHLSKGGKQITYMLIAINLIVFLLMVGSGVSIISPANKNLIKWGSNSGALTIAGEWWRLITCAFVHIGIIHLLFNMYALYFIGNYLEPMLGKIRYLAAYICTGVIASIASLWWHKNLINSAGASGAIFGLYGVFLALLTTNLISKRRRKALLQGIGIFIVFNLLYGMKAGIDNAAHIGGLLSGFIFGYIFIPSLMDEPSTKKIQSAAGLITLCTIVVSFMYLRNTKNDAVLFITKYDSMIVLQNKAMIPLKDTLLTDPQLLQQLQNISLPYWQKAGQLAEETKQYDLPTDLKRKRDLMNYYIQLRLEQTNILIKALKEQTNNYEIQVNEIGERLDSVVTEMNNLKE